LFVNSKVTVVSCIMIFTAKRPHPKGKKTFFGYFKDDGFVKRKNRGRVDVFGRWNSIREKWIAAYMNKEDIAGLSNNKVVTPEDEWCAEAYMETDYSLLTNEDFISNIKSFLAYKLLKQDSSFSISIEPEKPNIKFNLDISKWKYFRYDDGTNNSVFKIKKGKRLTKKDQSDGDIPYVSSSSLNNGIDNYLGNGHTDDNCLSFACYGSIGEVFYQDEKVWVSDNANVFYIRNKELNSYLGMFLITVLRLEQFRFSYGMTGKKERLQSFYIKLPVEKNGQPDWIYMEDFIKSLPYSKSL
jgi:type I restriction enzyme M protein